jgi:MFS-type transporter involved in bile tolerance (Atg22 family)
MSTSYIIQGCIGAITLLGMLIWLVIALYLAKTRASEFTKHFPNSLLIKLSTPSKHDGIVSQLLYIGALGSYTTFPSGHIKRGEISATDLLQLPAHIRRLFKIMHYTALGLIASLILTYLVGKYAFDL